MNTRAFTTYPRSRADAFTSRPIQAPYCGGPTAPGTTKVHLRDVPPLQLPIDNPNDRAFCWSRIAFLDFGLPQRVEACLKAYAIANDVSVEAVCLAVYSLLLSRYANADEIPVGLHQKAGDERLDGSPFLLVDCAPSQAFRLFSRRVQWCLRSPAFAARSKASGAISGFASFWCESAATSESEVEAAAESQAADNTVPFDLALRLRIVSGSLHPTLLYRRDRLNRNSIERISGHFLRLLAECLDRPDEPLAAFDMMAPGELTFVLNASNGGDTDFPQLCLHQLFAEHAQHSPNSIAVVFNDVRLTYRELDVRSNQIAHLLRATGIQIEDRIGVFTEPSVHMIAAILGILKAGGVYVPIDPAYPEERIRFLVEDAGLRAILTDSNAAPGLPTTAPIFCISGENCATRNYPLEAVPNWSSPESTAVLIYTSGSTGQPKGACIPHRAAVRTVRNTNYISVTPSDRIGQAGSISFDAAIKEIWLALANGATLVGVPRHTLLQPKQLQHWIQKEGITVLILNTSYVHQIAREAPEALSNVRKILFGGEAAEPGPLRLLLNHVAPGALVNGYGPAEGCVITSFHQINAIQEDDISVPIGRPVSNTRMYLLDAMRRPVPVGVPGEIYIGGSGVARGYWNRPELNAERFIPDTFGQRPGALLYRTGDLARLRENGTFEFLGRMDEQVKIRGHRIELAEVRHAIMTHPAVKQVFLTVREDEPGDRRLVAYFTLKNALCKPEESVRVHTRRKLPLHMVPAAFVVLDSIPLGANGKVDRKALPAPDQRTESDQPYEAAATDLERTLCRIWEELLRISPIGVHDNFFDLGGHSLLAARLIARIESELGRNIPVATLFDAPTIHQLAEKLIQSSCERSWAPLVKLRAPTAGTNLKPFFCVHSLGANLVSQYKIASLLGPDRGVYGLQPHGLDGKQQPLSSVEAIAAAYVQEIQKLQPHGPYLLGGVCLGGVVAYEMAQQLTTAGESVALVALIDSYMPGKLAYLHQRKDWTEYLDTHLGEILRLRGSARIRYFLRWMSNGGVRLRDALGFGERSSLARATRRLREAHKEAVLRYRPRPYQGKVVQLMCADGAQRSYEDRRLAWSSVVSSGLEVQIVPGNHLSMVEEPHIHVLANELEIRLRRAGGEEPTRSDDFFAMSSLQRKRSNAAIGLSPDTRQIRREHPLSLLPSSLGGELKAASGRT